MTTISIRIDEIEKEPIGGVTNENISEVAQNLKELIISTIEELKEKSLEIFV